MRNEQPFMTIGWKIFIVMTLGLGLVPFILMHISEIVGIYDPEYPRGTLIKQFSPLHNLSIIVIFVFIMFAALGGKAQAAGNVVDCSEVVAYAVKHASNDYRLANHPWSHYKNPIQIRGLETTDIDKNWLGGYTVKFKCRTTRKSEHSYGFSTGTTAPDSLLDEGVGKGWNYTVNKIKITSFANMPFIKLL